MARRYAPFFPGYQKQASSFGESLPKSGMCTPYFPKEIWQVIFNDDGESEWYVAVPDAGDKEQAVILSDALNIAQEVRGHN